MKSLLTGSVIFLCTFSAWAGTFLETFDAADMDEWQELIMLDVEPGSWEVLDGELQAISHGGLTRLLVTGDETWKDYTITVDIKPLKQHGPGNIAIAARVMENWAVWCVIGNLPILEPDSRAICYYGNFHDDDNLRLLKSKRSPFLKLNKWSTMKLRVSGNMLTLSVNGKQILGIMEIPEPIVIPGLLEEFPEFLTGGAGFGLTNYTARFDNITITGENIPDKGGLLVEPRAKLATTWASLKRF